MNKGPCAFLLLALVVAECRSADFISIVTTGVAAQDLRHIGGRLQIGNPGGESWYVGVIVDGYGIYSPSIANSPSYRTNATTCPANAPSGQVNGATSQQIFNLVIDRIRPLAIFNGATVATFQEPVAPAAAVPVLIDNDTQTRVENASDTTNFVTVGFSDGTCAVRRRQPNRFGLFDMLGNVSEWCVDRFGAHSPVGRLDKARIARGGAWADPLRTLRVANRLSLKPELRTLYVGFRFAIAAWRQGKEPQRPEAAEVSSK